MEKSNIKTFPKKTEEKKQNHIDSLSPREIVSELDRYVVGQNKAKKAVAVALRRIYLIQIQFLLVRENLYDSYFPQNFFLEMI